MHKRKLSLSVATAAIVVRRRRRRQHHRRVSLTFQFEIMPFI